ncbi:tRNA lysidine(34) synthetase TilS, partial [bacterium]|nr:tRNA lysidine(34) synthetase TilS [bacterium]
KSGYKVIAVHLNHNWRGNESDREENNCFEYAKQRGIEFYSEKLSADIKKAETAAREARYEFFRRCAEKFNSQVVFTAHNFCDNAETVLYRIIKGTGTAGLQGISEKREIFYRPLLKVSRDEIEKYCKDNNLRPNNDSSNNDITYKRNLIRKKLIPLMKDINPNVIGAINSLSQIAKEDFENKNEQKYFVRNLLKENFIDYDKKKIDDICEFINDNKKSKSGKTISLSDNLYLFVSNKDIKVIEKSLKSDIEVKIKSVGEYKFNKYIFSLKNFEGNEFKYPKDSEYRAFVVFDKIDFTLRYRKDGDTIQPLGMQGKQKLKKYFNEKKIPNYKKDFIPLLCKNNEVMWAAGCGINDKLKVIDKPTHIICIESC